MNTPPDVLLARVMKLREREDNPVIYQILSAQIACLEFAVDLAEEDDESNLGTYQARIEATMATLRAMPREVWDEWCEIPPHVVLPMFARIWRSFGKMYDD